MTDRKLARLVAEDHQLEAQTSSATLALMEHRWRVVTEHGYSIREYADALSRHHDTVRKYVRGWELWTSGGAGAASPADVLEQAKHSVETRTVMQAIAEADRIGVPRVRATRMPEVRRVREAIADVPAEEKPAAAKRYVEQVRATQVSKAEERSERRAQRTRSEMDLELELEKARRALQAAVVIVREAGLDQSVHETVVTLLAQVRLLMEQLSMQIAGRAGIDWDAELAKLGGAE